jgi:hypothetical protein
MKLKQIQPSYPPLIPRYIRYPFGVIGVVSVGLLIYSRDPVFLTLLVVSTFIASIKNGYQFRPETLEYRSYFEFFLLKTGKWESYSGAKFTIVKARLAQKFLSRSNRTMAITEEGYWLKMHLAKKY